MLRLLLLCCAVVAASGLAAAQTQPARPHRLGVPTAPSAYRNQPGTPAVAPATAPVMSAQDRQAYENCPDPRRFGPKTRPKKLVRIW